MRQTMTETRRYFVKGAFLLLAAMMLALSAAAFYRNEVSADEAVSTDRNGAAAENAVSTDKLQVTFQKSNKKYTLKNGKAYMKLSYQLPLVAGDSEAARAINDFYSKEKQKWINGHNNDRKDASRDGKNGGHAWSDDIMNCRVSFQDSYINIYQEGYYYTGGAHGMPYRISHIFSVATGQQVTAAQVFGLTNQQVNEKVREKYIKRYNKTRGTNKCQFYGFDNGKWLKKELKKIDFAGDEKYYLKKGKLVFYADPYMLGPYAGGFIEVSFGV